VGVTGPTVTALPRPADPGGAGSAADRQALQIDLGHAPGHEVGDDPRRAARHGPAHVAVAAVEDEVSVTAEPEDRRPVGRHGPETRAERPPRVVRAVREQAACETPDGLARTPSAAQV